jgi:transmembrane sensor
MVPGQQVIASAAGLDPARTVDTRRALAWREGRLVFHDRPLGEVVDSLARYHPGYVILADRKAADLAVSGSYRLDDVGAGFAGLADAAGLSLRTLPGGILVLE